MADVTYIPDGLGQGNNLLPWLLANNNGFGGLGGFNSIVDIFGLAIVAQMFGWGNGGWGGGWGGGFGNNAGSAAGFISNQLNNDSGRELIMNAITSQGEASRAAVQSLSTMIGQDFNLVNAAVQSLQNGISSLALQQAVSVPQLINAIQAGDNGLMAKLCECCCENRLLTTQQGYENRIQTIEQTNQLGSQADRNTAAITGSIADLKTAMVKEFCDAFSGEGRTSADAARNLYNNIVWGSYSARDDGSKPFGRDWVIVSARIYFDSADPAAGEIGEGDFYEWAAALAFCMRLVKRRCPSTSSVLPLA